jgi:HPt (histidine-containing phosphotransfer) domain-containing protein
LAEEGDHCKSAGMDDLLVKPANLMQLKEVLIKWLPVSETMDQQADISMLGDASQVNNPINFKILKEIVPSNIEQALVLQDFLAYIRTDNLKLMKLLELGDQVNAERMAHRMKGSSRMVGAIQLTNIYASIEKASQSGDITNFQAIIAELNDAIQQFEVCLLGMEDPKT